MAEPTTIARAAYTALKTAIKVFQDDESRTKVLLLFVVPAAAIFLLMMLMYYVLSQPLSFFQSKFSGETLAKIEKIHGDYTLNQGIIADSPDYVENADKIYDGVLFDHPGYPPVKYYNQLDKRWATKPYGTDKIGSHACGPTSMAIVINTYFPQLNLDPVAMATYAYEHGYWAKNSGSYHSIVPGMGKAFGLIVNGARYTEHEKVIQALQDGKLIVALMRKGHFTSAGHYMVLRGITATGKFLVADPASYKRSQQEWDPDIVFSESAKNAGAGGPFWIVSL